MAKLSTLISAPQRDTIRKLFRDLGIEDGARQAGFFKRSCGKPQPLTTADGNKVVQAQQAMLMQRVRPHYGAFTRLVSMLRDNRGELQPWERRFIDDVVRKIGGRSITPAIVKKVREVAHKHNVECGFPSFRELAAAAEQARAQELA